MAENENAKRITVRRTIEYHGEPDWVAGTLQRSIQVGRPLRLGLGYIATTQVVSEHEATDDFADGATRGVRPPLVYVAGPFGASTPELHEANVEHAAAYRQPLADLGCYPVVPHCNTRSLGGPTGFLDAVNPKQQEAWYQGSLELLRRCDAILLIPGWETSRGAKRERDAARGWGIPVLYSTEPGDVHGVAAWLRGLP